MKAIILAGGLGSRLRPLTDSTPKPLLPVAGKPIIQWQMEWLKNAGVKDFVLSIGHLADKVQAVLGDGAGIGVSIRYAMEHEPLGTAGALRNAMIEGSVEGPFYAGNGDVLTDLDPRLCEGLRSAQGMVAALALVPLPSPYGIIEAEDNGLVTAFREKPLLPHWINAGFYSLSQDVFDYLPEKGSLERDVFPALVQKGLLGGARLHPRFWRSVDTHKDLEESADFIQSAGDSWYAPRG